jgi:hypothetical protein
MAGGVQHRGELIAAELRFHLYRTEGFGLFDGFRHVWYLKIEMHLLLLFPLLFGPDGANIHGAAFSEQQTCRDEIFTSIIRILWKNSIKQQAWQTAELGKSCNLGLTDDHALWYHIFRTCDVPLLERCPSGLWS